MTTQSERRWNYFNVLEALVGQLPPGDYTADVGRWTSAIADLRDRYEPEYPLLFCDIHFVRRADRRAYSRQVSDFFVSQAFGGIKKVMNPAYERMKLGGESHQALVTRNQEYLSEFEAIIREMASKLKEDVEVVVKA